MRISDWSSDVCSSDLEAQVGLLVEPQVFQRLLHGIHMRGLAGEVEDHGRLTDRRVDRALGADIGLDQGDPTLGFREVERSEEHTSELQSLMRISYAVFCLKKKKQYKERTL